MPTKRVPEPRLIFEKSRPGRIGCNVPVGDTPEVEPDFETRDGLDLPEVGELDLLRHFTNLSQINYGIETGFYPLGSCTMKYNPKVNELTARMDGFAALHPMQPVVTIPGALELLARVQEMLAAITGFDEITLQPVAGAHGEMTCLMLVKAYHASRGEGGRSIVLVPDSAHGTNPASAARCGYDVVSIPTNAEGNTDLDALAKALAKDGPRIAALMLTNPSTLGLFEPAIERICAMVHEAGGQVFCDGANMNAMVGTTRPGDHGFDCMHLNLHKTFSTPHGGGGPGCGAIGLKSHLEPFLPKPVIRRAVPSVPSPENGFLGEGAVVADDDRPRSIGRVSGFYGQFLMEVRAYTYLRAFGREHMADISRHAVLNANYVRARLKDVLPPRARPPLHARVHPHRGAVQEGERRPRAGHLQAAHRLRLPPADELLPPHRPRVPHDRAHGDGVQGDPGRVLRRDGRHLPRGRRVPRAPQGGPLFADRRTPGRDPRGQAARRALASPGRRRRGERPDARERRGLPAGLRGPPPGRPGTR